MRELKRITESIPKEFLEALMKKETIAPTLKKVLEIGLTKDDSEVSPEEKAKFRTLINSGVLDREVEVLNHDTEKLIDEYLSAEIELAVKMGRLPPEAPQSDYMRKKGKKYVRKQADRLRKLFDSEGRKEEDVREGDDADAGPASARGSDDTGVRDVREERAGHEEGGSVPA